VGLRTSVELIVASPPETEPEVAVRRGLMTRGKVRTARSRVEREQEFYDDLTEGTSRVHRLLGRFSKGFYEKGPRGRLWAPVWQRVDLRGATVLDYGCGDGGFSWLLTGLGAKVVGMDISPRSIGQARAAGPVGSSEFPQFLVGDGHRTPFADGAFDYVVGNGALHHLDLDRAYAEIARVLRPGGEAIFQEPMCHHPLLWLLRRLTPKDHTADESPLSAGDIRGAKRWFRKVSHRDHFLLAVCAAPAHLLGMRAALTAVGLLDRIDQFLMRVAPRLRGLAWLTMLEMQK
jgi:SAM-dependent methyltransferase